MLVVLVEVEVGVVGLVVLVVVVGVVVLVVLVVAQKGGSPHHSTL